MVGIPNLVLFAKFKRTSRYKPWSSYIRSYKTDYLYLDVANDQQNKGFYWASSFLYSPYQLLLIPKIRELVPKMSRRLCQSHLRTWEFRLTLDEHQQNEMSREAAENTNLVIVLTALEAKYLPNLRGHRSSAVYTGSDSLVERVMEYQRSFDPVAMLEWLNWDTKTVRSTAEKLIHEADRLDPLRDWYELLRMCHPDMLNMLRGDALIALDYRRAAEILLRFYEDLQAHDAASPFVEIPKFVRGPYYRRLKYDLSDLDHVLMKFGLSPQPSLVLIIEGDTEEYIIPKVMDLLGISQHPSFIQIFNIKGVDKDFELLARYIVPPQLGDNLENAVLLTRLLQ